MQSHFPLKVQSGQWLSVSAGFNSPQQSTVILAVLLAVSKSRPLDDPIRYRQMS
jgi:hypothetical protein